MWTPSSSTCQHALSLDLILIPLKVSRQLNQHVKDNKSGKAHLGLVTFMIPHRNTVKEDIPPRLCDLESCVLSAFSSTKCGSHNSLIWIIFISGSTFLVKILAGIPLLHLNIMFYQHTFSYIPELELKGCTRVLCSQHCLMPFFLFLLLTLFLFGHSFSVCTRCISNLANK